MSDPDPAKVDDDLIGLWVRDGEETIVLSIGRTDGSVDGLPKGVMSTAEVRIDKDGKLTSEEARPSFFITAIGGEKFMNTYTNAEAVRTVTAEDKTTKVWDAKAVKGYLLCKYEVAKDTLTMWLGFRDLEVLARLIEGSKLAGEVKRDSGSLKSVKLTDSTENLAKFLKGGGSKELFPDPDKVDSHPVVYRRLKAGGSDVLTGPRTVPSLRVSIPRRLALPGVAPLVSLVVAKRPQSRLGWRTRLTR